MDHPEECRYGLDCYYRHKDDIDRSEYLNSINKPKVEVKKVIVSQPLREPKHWNVVKRAKTPLQLFGGEDAFPALGPAPPAQRVEFPEIVGEQKEPSEVKEESTEQEQEQESQELEKESQELEESQEQTTAEPQELELKEEQTAEAEPSEPQASSEFHSHIHVGGSSLVQQDGEDEGEWISTDTLSRYQLLMHYDLVSRQTCIRTFLMRMRMKIALITLLAALETLRCRM